jgi:hypothetical protein
MSYARLAGLIATASCIAFGTLPATAQSVEEQLRQRDAIINDLMRRVQLLERQSSTQPQQREQQQQAPAPSPPPVVAQPQQTYPVVPRGPEPKPGAEPEENVARALERSLVEQGGLLLAPGSFDIVPDFSYAHTGVTSLGIIGTSIASSRSRIDTITGGATFRAGLPWASQFNLSVPFVTSTTDISVGGLGGRTVSRTDSGIGDIAFGLSKQFVYEKGWIPDVIGQVQYKSTTGSAAFTPTDGRIGGTGSGFDAVTGGVTLTKRQDPLVLLGSAAYTHNFGTNHAGVNFSPGDAVDLRLGTLLAASPDTSLRFLFDVNFGQRLSIANTPVAGSDTVASIFEIGASAVLSRSTLLDVAVDIGMTRDAPDFTLLLSLPIHF